MTKPLYLCAFDKNRNSRIIAVKLFDTNLIVKKGLDKLGHCLGLEKIELPDGVKERMDQFANEDPELFEAYAVQTRRSLLSSLIGLSNSASNSGFLDYPPQPAGWLPKMSSSTSEIDAHPARDGHCRR